MSRVAGLATLHHPYAGTDGARALSGGLLAVAQTDGSQPREERYRLAAHWCEAGPFLPLSWGLDLSMREVRDCAPDTARQLRDAIEAAAGQIEFAVRIERLDAALPAVAASGSAYLRSLRRQQNACGMVLDGLIALASETRFTLALTSRRERAASALIRCAAADADRVRSAAQALVCDSTDVRIVLAGPLPPFGAGLEAVTRTGLARLERSA